jgi:spermidine/putrescine transport system permease protein
MKKKNYFLFGSLIVFFIIFYLPIINIFYQACIDNNSFTLSGFREIFQDKEIGYSFLHSIFIAIATVLSTLFISIKAVKDIFLRNKNSNILLLSFLNLLLPETVLAILLLIFFTALKIEISLMTLLIGHILLALGYVLPLLIQKYADINHLYFIAAYDLGASKEYVWKTITKPLLKPTIIACSFLGFIISFDDYVFSFFCNSAEYPTIANPLLALLKTGLTLKIKAFFVLIMTFSFLIGLFYILYMGFHNEKK